MQSGDEIDVVVEQVGGAGGLVAREVWQGGLWLGGWRSRENGDYEMRGSGRDCLLSE